MTPEERTIVLQAILSYRNTANGTIVCPTSWLEDRLMVKSSHEVAGRNWHKLGIEAQLGIWLTAPDSDYEFARDRTDVMKGQTQ